MNNELYGEDILLDETFQGVVAATGETTVSDGVQTCLQDLRLRLMTPLGELFYDRYFGSLLHEFVKAENTPSARMALTAEVARRIRMDARVKPETVTCVIEKWDPMGIEMAADCRLIDNPNIYSLVIKIGDGMEMIIKDVYPRQ